MFVTAGEVEYFTGYSPEAIDIAQAQAIIEVYTGRTESQVTDADDLELLARATAYQTVWLSRNSEQVFEQLAVRHLERDNFAINPWDEFSPYVAPLAKLACMRLSWMRSRSITTAPTFPKSTVRWEEV